MMREREIDTHISRQRPLFIEREIERERERGIPFPAATWKRVFITSKGQVTIEDHIPAHAPHAITKGNGSVSTARERERKRERGR